MPDWMLFVNLLQELANQTTVVMGDDDVYIPGSLKNLLILIFGGLGGIVTTLFWKLLSSLENRAARAEKQYDDLLPIVQDSTSTLDKLNTSVTTMIETYRDELRSAPRRTR